MESNDIIDDIYHHINAIEQEGFKVTIFDGVDNLKIVYYTGCDEEDNLD